MNYTGAGIFIIEEYKNKKCVLLFGMKNKRYCETGGYRDEGETIEETACRETKEESLNLINITPKEIKMIGKPIINKNYVGYFILIKEIDLNNYFHNIGIVYKNCDDHCWKETNDVVRIELDKMIENSKTMNLEIQDINGKSILIRDRTMELFINGLSIIDTLTKINLQISQVVYSKLKCLKNTFTYTISNEKEYAIFKNGKKITQFQKKYPDIKLEKNYLIIEKSGNVYKYYKP